MRPNPTIKYQIVIFGCQMNASDAERLAAVFDKLKFKKTDNINQADIIAVVMCSVRQSAVDRVHFLAHKFKKIKAKTILTGCILEKDRKKFAENFDYIIDIKDIGNLPKILARQQIFSRRGVGSPEREDAPQEKTWLPSKYNVPIMTGCNNFCSYCVVPYTRGREISRPAKEIICEVKKLVENSCKEIWLLGQNVNSYSCKIPISKSQFPKKSRIINFPKLLKMIDSIPGNFELNFTSSHPKDFSDELINVMAKCRHFSKRLNLPIQSGDDEILKKMNRPYTVAQYKNLVKKIRKAIPDISLSTDVIVGFPGETKKQFENTVKTFKEIGFDLAFINKYSPRPGTQAAKLKDDVPWQEKKRREKILIDLVNK